MAEAWFLRSASLHRADLFRGKVRTVKGQKQVHGATVSGREYYLPFEVRPLPDDVADEVRRIIEEHQYDRRKATGSDVEITRSADDAEVSFQGRIQQILGRERERIVKLAASLDLDLIDRREGPPDMLRPS